LYVAGNFNGQAQCGMVSQCPPLGSLSLRVRSLRVRSLCCACALCARAWQ